jgi:daunorubicin resistance ABC transporter ATP-binding subunit
VSEVAIEIINVVKRFGNFTALDNLNLEVVRGEIFGLLGPNGSGKTTTINIISGLSMPTTGKVRILGYDITKQSRAVRAILGAVPQETALYEELSAWRNMVFHAELYNIPSNQRDQRIKTLLELVQLTDRAKSRVSTFSGGMKRRLALARALLHNPELVYLDEPTLGVDVQSRRAIWDYILDLKKQGKTVLITTNYLEEANELCDRLAILDHGKLIDLNTPANLKRAYGDTIIELETEQLLTPEIVRSLQTIPGVSEVTQTEYTLRIVTTGENSATGQIINIITKQTNLHSINQREPNLDEVFLSLTGKSLRD